VNAKCMVSLADRTEARTTLRKRNLSFTKPDQCCRPQCPVHARVESVVVCDLGRLPVPAALAFWPL